MKAIVDDYFSKFLKKDISSFKDKVNLVFSRKRDKNEELLLSREDLIKIFRIDDKIIISTINKHYDFFSNMIKKSSVDDIFTTIFFERVANYLNFKDDIEIINIYFCDKKKDTVSKRDEIRKLTISDIDIYIKFRNEVNPTQKVDKDFLIESITRDINNGFTYGLFIDNNLVGATSMQMLPYMQERVEEIGISILPQFRNRGYGTLLLLNTTNAILDRGKIPICRASSDNIASNKMIVKSGYTLYANMLIF